MVNKIALLGKDVSKSPSPAMHNAAFKSVGLSFSYEAVSVEEENFKRTFHKLKKNGYTGFNVTIPYKEQVVPFLDKLSETAQKLEAVNTVLLEKGKGFGENTDVDGFVASVKEVRLPLPADSKAFILGAGGAGKATVEALFQTGVRRFVVAGRSPERLENFASWFKKSYQPPYGDVPFGDLLGSSLNLLSLETTPKKFLKEQISVASLFVNAAPLDACKEIPFFSEIEFLKGVLAVDWVYLPRRTPWLEKARKAGGTMIEGCKILLFQGMRAFELWTAIPAPREVMEKTLFEALG